LLSYLHMQISVLQLNINGGNYFQALTRFLKQNDFDILCLQEVTGANTFIGNIYSTRDTFKEISRLLSKTHKGELAISQIFTSDKKNSYDGNAIFYKKSFILKEKIILPLFENNSFFPSDSRKYKNIGRNVLSLVLEKDNKQFEILSTHLAWAKRPTEHRYQRQQNAKLVEYIKTLSRPFILTGDFNITQNQPTPKALKKYAISLAKKYHIKNTLDPKNHRVKSLFPKGLAVDYIYVSKEFLIEDFAVLEEIHISDHFALRATLNF